MDARAAAQELERRLGAVARAERAEQERRYLKSSLHHLGVSVPAIRRTALGFLGEHELDRSELLALARALWEEPVHERRMAAVEILAERANLLRPDDLPFVEELLRESRTWALADPLAIQVAGSLVDRWPELGSTLDRWAGDEDFWVRRSAMLALLPGLRAGAGDLDRFLGYANSMLEEREFFIRKAIGWVLRETGKRRPGVVVRWLGPRAGRASGVTLREAVKHLSEGQRERILRAAGR